MRKLALLLTIGVLQLRAEEPAPLPTEGWSQDFNTFMGTYASLPQGVSVSKDGRQAMQASDSDFRGEHNGNVTTGGCYSWLLATGDRALGYQPTADEFTPGWFKLSFSNTSSRIYRYIKLNYEIVCLNNADRSSGLELNIVMPEGLSTNIPAASFSSETTSDSNDAWERTTRALCVQLPEAVPPGQSFSILWQGNDIGGSGSRDEYGIDNVSVKCIESLGTVITIR